MIGSRGPVVEPCDILVGIFPKSDGYLSPGVVYRLRTETYLDIVLSKDVYHTPARNAGHRTRVRRRERGATYG